MTTTPTSAAPPTTHATSTALVAGGCFWCVEADLEKLPGVTNAVSGYAGGSTTDPMYETYAAEGHREVVEVTYDPNQLSFEALLIYTLKHMDPTDGTGSFNDRGESYAPALYYENENERAVIEKLLTEIDEQGPFHEPLAVAVEPRPTFYPAEDYHQDYADGAVSGLQYKYYRRASGRDTFIRKHWGGETGPSLPWRDSPNTTGTDPAATTPQWSGADQFVKPSDEMLREQLSSEAYRITQRDGTERAGTSPLDKEWRPGIYVDVVSGEPLFSSRDKFDSETGWPSFTQPITPDAVTERKDRKLFTTRTEVRSAIADSHLGHVFPDGPADRSGLRYCMNGAALEFVPYDEMAEGGYEAYRSYVQ